jgi:hypothetical protein
MYELILRVPIQAIYEGVAHEVRQTVRERAEGLCLSLERRPATKMRDHKIAHLRRVIEDLTQTQL